MKILGSIVALFGLLVAYVAWFPFREWAFSLVPQSAQWAKIIIVIVIGWIGGIAIPIALLVVGFGAFVSGMGGFKK